MQGILAYTNALLSRVLGWSKAEIDILNMHVLRELRIEKCISMRNFISYTAGNCDLFTAGKCHTFMRMPPLE